MHLLIYSFIFLDKVIPIFKENGFIEELYKIAEGQGPEFTKAFYTLILCQDPRPITLVRECNTSEYGAAGKQSVTRRLLELAANKDEYALNAISVLTRTSDIAETFCGELGLISLLALVVAPQNSGMTVAAATAPHLAEPVWRIIANTCWIAGVGKCLCEKDGLRCVYSYLTLGQESLQRATLQALDGICTKGSKDDSAALVETLFEYGDLPGVVISLCTTPQTLTVQHAALRFCATLAAISARFCGRVAEVVGGVDILLHHATYACSVEEEEPRDVEVQMMERAMCTLATLVGSVNPGVAASGKLIGAFTNAVRSLKPATPARLHAIRALGCYGAHMEWNVEGFIISNGTIAALVSAMDLAYPQEAYSAGMSLCSLIKASPEACGTAAISAGIVQSIISFLTAKDSCDVGRTQEEGVVCGANVNYRDLGVHIAACLTSDSAGMNALGSSQQALEALVDIFSDTSRERAVKEEIVALLLAMFMTPEIAAFDRFIKIAGLEGVFNLLVSG